MTLIIETGASLASANSYYSVASVNTYFSDMGITTWTGATATLEANLIRSARFMETLAWQGIKTLSTQALEWPRRNITDRNGYYISSTCIPLRIKQGQAELALRYLTNGNPAPDLAFSEGRIVMEKVDVVEIRYSQDGKRDVPQYLYIDYLFKPYLCSTLNVELVRA